MAPDAQGFLLPEEVPPGITDQLMEAVKPFAVALFGIDHDHQRVLPSGSGTLVKIGDVRYILTAAHVWIEALAHFRELGVGLKENAENRFRRRTTDFSPAVILSPDQGWNEWGPDLALLNIPPDLIGTFEANRAFYDLTRERCVPSCPDDVETWALTGAAEADVAFDEEHQPTVLVSGFHIGPPTRVEALGEFDYLDVRADLTLAGVPVSFSGVSGGGLWHFVIHRSVATGTNEIFPELIGAAFYQLPVVDDSRMLRCHGPQSISKLIQEMTHPKS